jgi:hypothetical protein
MKQWSANCISCQKGGIANKINGFYDFTNFSFCATHCNNRGGKSVMLVPYEK